MRPLRRARWLLVFAAASCGEDAAPRPAVETPRHDEAPPRPAALDLAAIGRLGREEEDGAAVRDDVARAVVRAGADAVPLLVEALRSADERLSDGANAGFALVPGPSTRALVALLDDEGVRGRAVDALARIEDWWAARDDGVDVVRRLASGLRRSGGEERIARLAAIRNSGRHAAAALDAIGEMLRVATGDELQAAAWTAGSIGEKARGLAPLLAARLVEHRDEAGVSALGSALIDVGPLDADTTRLLARRLTTAPQGLRQEILDVLKEAGASDAGVVDAVAAFIASEDSETATAAISALAAMPGGAERAARAAVKAASADVGSKDEQVGALEDLGPRFADAIPYLVETATSGAPTERVAAVRALGLAPPDLLPRVLPVLRAAFVDASPTVREAAADVLIGRDAPLPDEDALLDAALLDTNAAIRVDAVAAIGARAKGRRDATAAAARIAPFLADANSDVRFQAGNALLDIGAAPPAQWIGAVRKNLRSKRREIRLSAARAAVTFGPAAEPAVPELLVMIHDPDLGSFAVTALAATGVLDERVRAELSALVKERSRNVNAVLDEFGRRAGFLDEEVRKLAVAAPDRVWPVSMARATDDPAGFIEWVRENGKLFENFNPLDAYGELGVAGLHALVEEAAAQGRRADVTGVRRIVRKLGGAAAGPLVEIAGTASPGAVALALDLLAIVGAREGAETFARFIEAKDVGVRAAAVRGAAAAMQAGAGAAPFIPILVARLDDDAPVRAAAFSALAAAGRAPPEAIGRARTALDDRDPRVRVAAASAVFALAGDTPAAVRVLRETLNVPAPFWSDGLNGHRRDRPEDEYSDAERVWIDAARTLGRIGPAAASAAEDLTWAALRHGEPGVQRIFLDALAAMGPAAAPADPLVRRLGEKRRSPLDGAKGFDDAVARTLAALGLEPSPSSGRKSR